MPRHMAAVRLQNAKVHSIRFKHHTGWYDGRVAQRRCGLQHGVHCIYVRVTVCAIRDMIRRWESPHDGRHMPAIPLEILRRKQTLLKRT